MSLTRRTAVVACLGAVATTIATTGMSGSATALGSATATGPVVASAQHPNGAAIGWSSVAASGARLAVVQATDGTGYRNPWFFVDYNGARAAGLVRGSLAVGRPGLPIATTAWAQADAYLARLGGSVTTSRTLAPVLDLETTGGLSSAQLVTWAQTFLLRVHARSGRIPILRTYSYFWHTALADPDAFARFPVWIATTGTPPDTPTALWSANSSTWVPGIAAQTETTQVTADDATWQVMQDGTSPGAWPDGAPGAPEQVQVVPWDSAATLTWLPGDAGSSDVTAYHVLAEPGDISVTVPGDTATATVGGLVDGTSYQFTVTAENAVGVGQASAPTDPSVPDATLGAVPVTKTAPVARSLYTTNCMRPESLVAGTRWRRRVPSPGVLLMEGQHHDPRGLVGLHVLWVDVKNPHVRFAPLMHHVADRRALTRLSRHSTLVASTNAGYFDSGSGAPLNPVVVGGLPVFGPSVTSAAVGFGPDGLMHSAALAATGTVTGPHDPVPLAGWNPAQPAEGINAYSARWGSHPVPMPSDAVSRLVTNGVVSSATGRSRTAPAHGYLLVARGAVAAGWLRSLALGDRVSVRVTLTSSSRTPLSLAYSVGTHLVIKGVAQTGSRCKRTEHLPARTAIGWTADRRHLVLVAIDNVPHTKFHGVEPDQLARIMHDLGAVEAFMFDGGGSTEMVVRPRAGARLTIRNHPTGNTERKIPVGFGIFRR
jgi:GH25 family lysozyme M1 (1,4-beta-N-acetylmuramidase)